MEQKPLFLWVESLPGEELVWDKLTDPVLEKPDTAVFAAHLADRSVHGKIRVENELQVMVILTADQEHMIPIPFVVVKTHADEPTHLARTREPERTLCGREVRRRVNVSLGSLPRLRAARDGGLVRPTGDALAGSTRLTSLARPSSEITTRIRRPLGMPPGRPLGVG